MPPSKQINFPSLRSRIDQCLNGDEREYQGGCGHKHALRSRPHGFIASERRFKVEAKNRDE